MRALIKIFCALALLLLGAAAHADFGRPAVYLLNGNTYASPAEACKAIDPNYPHPMGLAPSSSSAETETLTMCLRTDRDVGVPTAIGNHCPNITDRVRLARTPAAIVGNGVALAADTCNYSGKDPGTEAEQPDKMCGDTFRYAGWHVGGEYTDFMHISGKIDHGAQFCVPFAPAGADKGCKVEFDLTSQYQNDDKSWSSYGKLSPVERQGSGGVLGESCTPTEKNPPGDGETPKPEKSKCENGYQGEVNGVATCVPNVKNNGVDLGGDTKTETKPDGTKTETTTKTECAGGKCTTTTTVTTTPPGGVASTQITKIEQPEKEFCSANPTKCQGGKADTGNGGKGSSTGNGSGNGSCTGNDCEDNNGPTLPGKPGFGKYGAPGQPDLYKSKYPDGISGVWSAKTSEIKSAPISNLVGDLMPKVADGGTPPTWIIDLDMGGIGNFGQRDISPPSWLWGVLKAITILSALLLARRLVFGG